MSSAGYNSSSTPKSPVTGNQHSWSVGCNNFLAMQLAPTQSLQVRGPLYLAALMVTNTDGPTPSCLFLYSRPDKWHMIFSGAQVSVIHPPSNCSHNLSSTRLTLQAANNAGIVTIGERSFTLNQDFHCISVGCLLSQILCMLFLVQTSLAHI